MSKYKLLASELKNSKILITGGTGFFGKNLLHFFRNLNNIFNANIELYVLTRNKNQFLKKYPEFNCNFISYIMGNIKNFNNANISFDYVIHAATKVETHSELNSDLFDNIVNGTKHLISIVKRTNKNARLLFISSGAVYGTQPPELTHISEKFQCNPITSYGKGKLEAEKSCLDSGIHTSIARCFTFTGPYLPLNAHFAIGNFILNGINNTPIIINGDGSPYRSYMYTSDLVEWLMTILLSGKTNEIYNVGSDIPVSILELAKKVNSYFNNKLNIIVKEKPPLNITPARYIPSIEKAKNQLKLNLNMSLDKAISKTVKSYL
jgi:nucleoside-diphosphate-sugar epimerase